MRIIRLFFWAAVACTGAHASDTAVFSSNGRLTGLLYDGDELEVASNLGAPLPGWVNFAGLEKSDRTDVARDGATTTWTGTIGPVENQRARFRQTVREDDGKVRIDVEVSADESLEAEGVFFRIDLPRDQFAGGRVSLLTSAGPKESVFPVRRLSGLNFVSGEAGGSSSPALPAASGSRSRWIAPARFS